MRSIGHVAPSKTARRGFSLVELALVLGISGLMLGFVLQSQQSAAVADCYAAAKLQLRDIDGAIQRFARQKDRLPLPAARTVGVEAPTYGRESSGGAIDAAGGASWGALPFQALGLAPSYASDCWGNKLTYVVTTALTTSSTSGGYLDTAVQGNITLRKDATTNSGTDIAYAVISHGVDGLGAVKNNYSNSAKGWRSNGDGICTSTSLMCFNAIPSATVASAAFNNGKDAGAAYFDDVIVTRGRPVPAIVSTPGNLYCWGENADSQLGNGNTTDRYHPLQVTSSLNFDKVYTSHDYRSFCALTADGTPYCWGNNEFYQLGLATCNGCNTTGADVTTPAIIPGGFKFSKLAVGERTSCGIVAAGGSGTAGELRCWGDSAFSIFTRMTIPNASLTHDRHYGTPQVVGGAAASRTFADVYTWSNDPFDFTGCAIEAGGGINNTWCWGKNDTGIWGMGNKITPGAGTVPLQGNHGISVKKMVSAGSSFCYLANNERIYCWGSNTDGQLGLGHNGYGTGYAVPPAVVITGGGGSGAAATARLLNGGIVAFDMTSVGSGYTSAPTVTVGGLTGIATAIVNNNQVIALRSPSNRDVGAFQENLVPTEVSGGRSYTDIVATTNTFCAIEKTTNQTYCWGKMAS